VNDMQAPEIQTMYSLNIPVSAVRTKMRQEFERHRYVNQIGVVDVLITQSHAEYQVRPSFPIHWITCWE
jgi:NADH dehydrogenase (ubiquinone) 1 alpha subcomplex subunit 6